MASDFTKKDYISISLIFLSVFIFYYARNNFVNISSLLWAEDGTVFLSEVYRDGIKSVFNQYAGYQHLYPRLVSLIVYFTDISFAPIIFLIATLIPLLMLVTVAYRFICSLGINYILASFITLTTFSVPLTNEIYLNLTNIQWYIFILMFLVIIYKESRSFLPKYIFYPLFLIFSLTGPFSIYLACVIVLKIFLDRFRFKLDDIVLYCIVFVSSVVQFAMILLNDRVGSDISNDLMSFAELFCKTLLLGSNRFITQVIAFTFFILFFIYVYKYKKVEKDSSFNYFIYFIYSVVIYALSIVVSIDISSLGPLGIGSRYFLFIYFVMILSIPIITKNRKVIISLLSLILLFWISVFITSRLKDSDTLFYFDYLKSGYSLYEFVDFAKVEPGVEIPLNPYWDNNWNLDIHNHERKIEPITQEINVQVEINQGVSIDLYNMVSANCSNAKDIGIKFYITSSSPNKDNAVVRVILLNKFNKAQLPLKQYRFNDNLKYPIKVDGKQQVLQIDNDNKFMIYPVALNINEYNRLVIETANTPVNIDKLELFCLD